MTQKAIRLNLRLYIITLVSLLGLLMFNCTQASAATSNYCQNKIWTISGTCDFEMKANSKVYEYDLFSIYPIASGETIDDAGSWQHWLGKDVFPKCTQHKKYSEDDIANITADFTITSITGGSYSAKDGSVDMSDVSTIKITDITGEDVTLVYNLKLEIEMSDGTIITGPLVKKLSAKIIKKCACDRILDIDTITTTNIAAKYEDNDNNFQFLLKPNVSSATAKFNSAEFNISHSTDCYYKNTYTGAQDFSDGEVVSFSSSNSDGSASWSDSLNKLSVTFSSDGTKIETYIDHNFSWGYYEETIDATFIKCQCEIRDGFVSDKTLYYSGNTFNTDLSDFNFKAEVNKFTCDYYDHWHNYADDEITPTYSISSKTNCSASLSNGVLSVSNLTGSDAKIVIKATANYVTDGYTYATTTEQFTLTLKKQVNCTCTLSLPTAGSLTKNIGNATSTTVDLLNYATGDTEYGKVTTNSSCPIHSSAASTVKVTPTFSVSSTSGCNATISGSNLTLSNITGSSGSATITLKVAYSTLTPKTKTITITANKSCNCTRSWYAGGNVYLKPGVSTTSINLSSAYVTLTPPSNGCYYHSSATKITASSLSKSVSSKTTNVTSASISGTTLSATINTSESLKNRVSVQFKYTGNNVSSTAYAYYYIYNCKCTLSNINTTDKSERKGGNTTINLSSYGFYSTLTCDDCIIHKDMYTEAEKKISPTFTVSSSTNCSASISGNTLSVTNRTAETSTITIKATTSFVYNGTTYLTKTSTFKITLQELCTCSVTNGGGNQTKGLNHGIKTTSFYLNNVNFTLTPPSGGCYYHSTTTTVPVTSMTKSIVGKTSGVSSTSLGSSTLTVNLNDTTLDKQTVKVNYSYTTGGRTITKGWNYYVNQCKCTLEFESHADTGLNCGEAFAVDLTGTAPVTAQYKTNGCTVHSTASDKTFNKYSDFDLSMGSPDAGCYLNDHTLYFPDDGSNWIVTHINFEITYKGLTANDGIQYQIIRTITQPEITNVKYVTQTGFGNYSDYFEITVDPNGCWYADIAIDGTDKGKLYFDASGYNYITTTYKVTGIQVGYNYNQPNGVSNFKMKRDPDESDYVLFTWTDDGIESPIITVSTYCEDSGYGFETDYDGFDYYDISPSINEDWNKHTLYINGAKITADNPTHESYDYICVPVKDIPYGAGLTLETDSSNLMSKEQTFTLDNGVLYTTQAFDDYYTLTDAKECYIDITANDTLDPAYAPQDMNCFVLSGEGSVEIVTQSGKKMLHYTAPSASYEGDVEIGYEYVTPRSDLPSSYLKYAVVNLTVEQTCKCTLEYEFITGSNPEYTETINVGEKVNYYYSFDKIKNLEATYKNNGCSQHSFNGKVKGTSVNTIAHADGCTTSNFSQSGVTLNNIDKDGATLYFGVKAEKNGLTAVCPLMLSFERTISAPEIKSASYEMRESSDMGSLTVDPNGNSEIEFYINGDYKGTYNFGFDASLGEYKTTDFEFKDAYDYDTEAPNGISNISIVRDGTNAKITFTGGNDKESYVPISIYGVDSESWDTNNTMLVKSYSTYIEFKINGVKKAGGQDARSATIPIADLKYGDKLTITSTDLAGNTTTSSQITIPTSVLYTTVANADTFDVHNGYVHTIDVDANDVHDTLYTKPNISKLTVKSGSDLGTVSLVAKAGYDTKVVQFNGIHGKSGTMTVEYEYAKVRSDIPAAKGTLTINIPPCKCTMSAYAEDFEVDMGYNESFTYDITDKGLWAEYIKNGCLIHENAPNEVVYDADEVEYSFGTASNITVNSRAESTIKVSNPTKINGIYRTGTVQYTVSMQHPDYPELGATSLTKTITFKRILEKPVITECNYDPTTDILKIKVDPKGRPNVGLYFDGDYQCQLNFDLNGSEYAPKQFIINKTLIGDTYNYNLVPNSVSNISIARDTTDNTKAKISWNGGDDKHKSVEVTVYGADNMTSDAKYIDSYYATTTKYITYKNGSTTYLTQSTTSNSITIPISNIKWDSTLEIYSKDILGGKSGTVTKKIPNTIIYNTVTQSDSATVKEGSAVNIDIQANDTHDSLYSVPSFGVEVLGYRIGTNESTSFTSGGSKYVSVSIQEANSNESGIGREYIRVDAINGATDGDIIQVKLKYTYEKVREDATPASDIVIVTIEPTNQPPVAVDDYLTHHKYGNNEATAIEDLTFNVIEGQDLVIPVSMLLNNDTDREVSKGTNTSPLILSELKASNGSGSIKVKDKYDSGTTTISNNTSLGFTMDYIGDRGVNPSGKIVSDLSRIVIKANSVFSGKIQFKYKVSDGEKVSESYATVTIDVPQSETPPVFTDGKSVHEFNMPIDTLSESFTVHIKYNGETALTGSPSSIDNSNIKVSYYDGTNYVNWVDKPELMMLSAAVECELLDTNTNAWGAKIKIVRDNTTVGTEQWKVGDKIKVDFAVIGNTQSGSLPGTAIITITEAINSINNNEGFLYIHRRPIASYSLETHIDSNHYITSASVSADSSYDIDHKNRDTVQRIVNVGVSKVDNTLDKGSICSQGIRSWEWTFTDAATGTSYTKIFNTKYIIDSNIESNGIKDECLVATDANTDAADIMKGYYPDRSANNTETYQEYDNAKYAKDEGRAWINEKIKSALSKSGGKTKSYQVTLRVRDVDGPDGIGEWSITHSESISGTPMAPVAAFETESNKYYIHIDENDNYSLNLGIEDKSTDANGDDEICEWNWTVENNSIASPISASITKGKTTKDSAGTNIQNTIIGWFKEYVNNTKTPIDSKYTIKLKVKDSTGLESDEVTKTIQVFLENDTPSINTDPSKIEGGLNCYRIYEVDDKLDGSDKDTKIPLSGGRTAQAYETLNHFFSNVTGNKYNKLFAITDRQLDTITMDYTFSGLKVETLDSFNEAATPLIQRTYSNIGYYTAPFTNTPKEQGFIPGFYKVSVVATDHPSSSDPLYDTGSSKTATATTYKNSKPYHLAYIPKLYVYPYVEFNGHFFNRNGMYVDGSDYDTGTDANASGFPIGDSIKENLVPSIGDTVSIYVAVNEYVEKLTCTVNNGITTTSITLANTGEINSKGYNIYKGSYTINDVKDTSNTFADITVEVIGDTWWGTRYASNIGSSTFKTRSKKNEVTFQVLPVKLSDFRVVSVTDPSIRDEIASKISSLKTSGIKLSTGNTVDGIPVSRLAVDNKTVSNGQLMRKGYSFYFKVDSKGLKTDGSSNDYIRIIPSFYSVTRDSAGNVNGIGAEVYGFVPNNNGQYMLYTSTSANSLSKTMYPLYYEGTREHSLGNHSIVTLNKGLTEQNGNLTTWSGRYGIPADAKFSTSKTSLIEYTGEVLVAFKIDAIKNGAVKYNYVDKEQWSKERGSIASVYKTIEASTLFKNNKTGSVLVFNGAKSIKDNYVSRPVWNE